MTIEQGTMANPFGMDRQCTNCPDLVEARSSIVHGYGDVTADFLFVAESPHPRADRAGHPLVRSPDGYDIVDVLVALRLTRDRDGAPPALENAYVTHVTRCRHPNRPATDREVRTCEPFLDAEIRSINPEIIVPVGNRALRELVGAYTTNDPDETDIQSVHGSTMRGRGFEIIPMKEPGPLDTAGFEAFLEEMRAAMGRDYRQTKGRRRR